MSLQSLSKVKLSKQISEYTDHLKCLECCKFFIAPATATCGHTLCHTCWRGRRTCPQCASSLDRKTLKLNLPLQNLTNHIQTLGEAFEKLFKIQLDEFSLDTPGDIESEKDPVKHVKDWLASSQNHFSAPTQNTETFSQVSQQPQNPLEVSSSNIIIHSDERKGPSPFKVTKVVHIPQPQDDWDKIETMPDTEIYTKQNENVIGPMDIEPFHVNENEYTTDHPRRSSRKRDVTHDDSNAKVHELTALKQNSGDSSLENDKKSQKGKQTWHNVKKMRKEFSKLNKKNRGKLNVSIELAKKTQNLKASKTPHKNSQHIVNIDENTPEKVDRKNEVMVIDSNHTDNTENVSANANDVDNEKSKSKQGPTEFNYGSITPAIKDNSLAIKSNSETCEARMSKEINQVNISNNSKSKDETKMLFIKKSALCPKNIDVITINELPKTPEQETVSSNCDDIEISIKIGTTVTNIVIKKKNDVQVRINTDREVQTSLGPHHLATNELLEMDNVEKVSQYTQKNVSNSANQASHINNTKSTKSQVELPINKFTSEKKNTASAETASAQFEITESVEKELSNSMEYETVEGQTVISKNVGQDQHLETNEEIEENLKNIDELNDIDIFSGSVKEGNVEAMKVPTPSEILVSTVCSKSKTQRNAEKRYRENVDECTLPRNKKLKVTTPQSLKDKSVLPDSEGINYDVIMGQVFASIDADMEDIRKSQEPQLVQDKPQKSKPKVSDETKSDRITNKLLSQMQKTQIINEGTQSDSQIKMTKENSPELVNEKHSECIFTIVEKDDSTEQTKNDEVLHQVEELLTPALCHNLDSSEDSPGVIQNTNKTNKKTREFDDRSVVEETPQKDLSFPKAKRISNANLSQVSINETKKIPSKLSSENIKSIINITDTDREFNDSNKDVSVIEGAGKKLTLETPLTISKFVDHIIHKSTPMARKSLNFDNENKDPEQTLCPTSDAIAKTTQEREFMTKAFESTPLTQITKPQTTKNVPKTNKMYCLAASRLTPDEISKVKIVCAQQKWRYVENYSKDITHLVVSVDEENKSQRSVKYMCALADSKWIVSFAWIEHCLRNKDTGYEEYFEALDSFGEPGPKRSRVAKHKLFTGIKFYCMEPFSVLNLVTLKNMLVSAGGRVVSSLKEVRVTQDSGLPALVLAEPENTQEDQFIYLAMEHSVVPVNFEWVLNCLGSYTLGSIQELLLCPSTLLPKGTARWPDVLMAPDYE